MSRKARSQPASPQTSLRADQASVLSCQAVALRKAGLHGEQPWTNCRIGWAACLSGNSRVCLQKPLQVENSLGAVPLVGFVPSALAHASQNPVNNPVSCCYCLQGYSRGPDLRCI